MPGGNEKRRLGLVLVGLVLVVGTAFGFWYVLQSVDERQGYVVASRDVVRWDRVGSSDFAIIEANVGEAVAMTPNEMGPIYGQWATGSIPVGTLITPGMFQVPPMSSESESKSVVISLPLPSGEVAFGALATGDRIALIGREPDDADPLADALGDSVAAAPEQPPLALIGILELEDVRDNQIFYVGDPLGALELLELLERFERAQDSKIWRIGIDVTAEELMLALQGETATVGTDSGRE